MIIMRFLSLATLALSSLAACGGSGGGSSGTDGGSDARGDGAIGGDDAGPELCATRHECAPPPKTGQTCFAGLDTTLKDPSGAAVVGADVFVCGTDVCTSPVQSDAQGKVSIEECAAATSPSFKFPDDPKWAPFVTLLAGAGPTYSIPSVTVVPLPSQGATMGQKDVTSNGVTLSLSGVTFAFDIEHTDPDSQSFRAVMIPAEQAPPGVDPSLALEAFVGLAPLNTTLTPGAVLSFPNPKPGAWGPNAKIDVYLNGADGGNLHPPAPWGTFAPIGSASVSGDDQRVTTDPLPEVAMIGLRLHHP